jgi:hypothetical protein
MCSVNRWIDRCCHSATLRKPKVHRPFTSSFHYHLSSVTGCWPSAYFPIFYLEEHARDTQYTGERRTSRLPMIACDNYQGSRFVRITSIGNAGHTSAYQATSRQESDRGCLTSEAISLNKNKIDLLRWTAGPGASAIIYFLSSGAQGFRHNGTNYSFMIHGQCIRLT